MGKPSGLSFVDSDDYIHPKMLEVLLDAVRTTGVKISSCSFLRTQGEPLETKEIPAVEFWTPKDYYLNHCVNATVAWGKLYHRDCFQNIRYPLGKLHEDEFVTYRILFAEPQVAVIPEPLYGYYQNPAGIMGTWRPERLDVLEALYEQMLFFQSLNETNLMQNRMGMYDYFFRKYLGAVVDHPEETVRKECVNRFRFWTPKILRLYHTHSLYSVLDYQKLYEFIYPAWIVRTICGSWKTMSKIKQSLKGR